MIIFAQEIMPNSKEAKIAAEGQKSYQKVSTNDDEGHIYIYIYINVILFIYFITVVLQFVNKYTMFCSIGEGDDEEEMPEDLKALTPEQQQSALKWRSFQILGIGAY